MVGLALDDRGREWLFEFRDRHRSELERIHSLWGSSVGVRLRVRREGTARNSPVTVNALGREAAVERGVTKLVACLGLPAIRASKPETNRSVCGLAYGWVAWAPVVNDQSYHYPDELSFMPGSAAESWAMGLRDSHWTDQEIIYALTRLLHRGLVRERSDWRGWLYEAAAERSAEYEPPYRTVGR